MAVLSKNSEPSFDHAVAGGVSGFVTRFICQPLDVLKIRFQLQVEPIRHHDVSKYRSLLQAFILILEEEKIFALWKGHVPAQLLSIVYGMGQFYSYNIFTKYSNKFSSMDKWKHSVHFVGGAAAGTVATVISFPFDTIRTRLVAQSSNHQVYKGVIHSFSTIWRHESPKAFFFGLTPTILQIAPHTGLQFTFYEIITDIYKKRFHNKDTNFYNSMISGSIAGLISKTIIYPFDLARKRLQIQGFEHGRKGFGKFFHCKGLIDCIRITIKEEGVKGLFKGLVPSQLKAAVTTALHFTVYEQMLQLLKTV